MTTPRPADRPGSGRDARSRTARTPRTATTPDTGRQEANMASKTNTTDAPTTDAPETTEETTEVKAPKWTPLDADRAAWVASHARPAVSRCLCGCDETTKGRFFPGHDATLKEALKSTVLHGDDAAKASAEAALATFGW